MLISIQSLRDNDDLISIHSHILIHWNVSLFLLRLSSISIFEFSLISFSLLSRLKCNAILTSKLHFKDAIMYIGDDVAKPSLVRPSASVAPAALWLSRCFVASNAKLTYQKDGNWVKDKCVLGVRSILGNCIQSKNGDILSLLPLWSVLPHVVVCWTNSVLLFYAFSVHF